MTQLGLQPEEWGGETMFVDVSAKTKQGLDDLLESILLLAEVEELKANPDAEASGVVVESKLDPGRGAVVTVLVQRGTLQGRRRAGGRRPLGPRARDARLQGQPRQGRPARPSRSRCSASTPCPRPASSCAWSRTTAAPARSPASAPPPQARGAGAPRRPQASRWRTSSTRPATARSRSSTSCSRPTCRARWRRSRTRSPSCRRQEVKVNIVRSGVGGITESDVNLAAASDAVIIGFNVRPVGEARQLAEREGVEIRTYSVIYRAIDDLRDAMQGMLAPEEVEETVGDGRGARDLPRLAGRHDRRLATSPRAGSRAAPRCGWCATGRSSTTARSRRCGASTTTSARWPPGSSAASCSQNFADIKEGDELEVYETRQVERTLS